MNTRSMLFLSLWLLVALCNRGWAQPGVESDSGTLRQCVVDPAWPRKPANVQWAAMPGIAIDDQDQVYIFTRFQPTVQVYRTDGTLVRAWHTASFQGSHHIKIGPDGSIWTSDIENHVVRKHAPDGKVLLTLGTAGEAGDDERHFNKPTDSVVLPSGDIFVSDGYGNRRVVHFDKQGKFVKQWGTEGVEPGQFALPHAIAADSQGRLYVADRENARVQVFDQAGKLLAVWADTVTPWGIFITGSDEIWVCGSSAIRATDDSWMVIPPQDQLVLKLTAEGKIVDRYILPKTAEGEGRVGEVNWVHGIAVDSQGNFYVGDIQGKRAQKYVVQKP